MKRFKTKLSGEIVHAHRWDGGLDKEGMRALIDWLVDQDTPGGIKFNESDGTHDLVIKQGDSTVTAHAGDWVMQYLETGAWDAMDSEDFPLLLEEV